MIFFFFSSRRRHTRLQGDWSSDVCSSDLNELDGEDYDLNAVVDSFIDRRADGQQSERIYTKRLRRRRDVAVSFLLDRKSTRLNSSHLVISYAVFCLKKKKFRYSSYRYDAD